MLVDLHIQDFALAGRVAVQFGPGLNVLTGETGAGKSIIIDALSALVGGRAGANEVREGSQRALIEGAFVIDPGRMRELLEPFDAVPDESDDTLILSREISAEGRSRCRINGRLANVASLAQVGRALVDIHGQHDHQSLFQPARHLDLLDALGGDEISRKREIVGRLAARRQELLEEMERLREGERERARREDLLTYQIQEIKAAALAPGEDAELEAERARLVHAERLAQGVGQAYAALYEGDGHVQSAVDLAGEALRQLEGLTAFDPGLASLTRALEQAVISIQEVARDLRRYQEGLSADSGRLAEVESRLELINRLKRKYGATIDEILTFTAGAQKELDALTGSAQRLEQLQGELVELEAELAKAAVELSAARQEVAGRVSAAITERLRALNMAAARFEVAFDLEEDPDGIAIGGRKVAVTRRGIDRVEFLFSANPGESPKPLAKIASGGEMSRVTLAIKATLAQVDPASTLVFDEVDAGVGGQTAERVAEALVELARTHQVLVITHLAQIAVRADRHMTVVKEESGGRVSVSVRPLEGEARVREIARMLDGQATATSFDHAKALLEMARRAKTAS